MTTSTTKTKKNPKKALPAPPKPAGLLRAGSRWRLDGRKWVLLVLVLVLAALLVGVVQYHRRQEHLREARALQTLQEDKVRFYRVEKDMDAAYAGIVADVGKPVREEEVKSCFHKSAKFKEGDLVCGVNIHANYDKSIDDLKLLRTIADVFQFNADTLQPALSFSTGNTGYVKEYDFVTTNAIDCSLRVEGELDKSEISFDCSDTLEQPIYPLAE